MDRLIDIMAVSTDDKERFNAAQEAEKMLLKDVAMITALNPHSIRAWSKKLDGVIFTDSGKINLANDWGGNIWIKQ